MSNNRLGLVGTVVGIPHYTNAMMLKLKIRIHRNNYMMINYSFDLNRKLGLR